MDKKVQYLNDATGLSQVRIGNTESQVKKVATVSKVNDLLRKVASSPAGRQAVINKIAKFLSEPLRQFLDINGIARNFFIRDNKNEGEIAYYDLDLFPMTNALTLGMDGNPVLNWVSPRRFFVNFFIIANIAKVHLATMKWYRYDVLTRAKDRLRESLMYKEDMLFFKLATAAAIASNNVDNWTTDTSEKEVTLGRIGQMMTRLETVPLAPYALVYHPVANATFRSWNNTKLDEVGRIEVRTTGFLGEIFGLNVFITKLAPAWSDENNTYYSMYLSTAPEYFGIMPMWADAEVYASNNLDLMAVGFVAWEMLGMAVYNPRSVAMAKFAAASNFFKIL